VSLELDLKKIIIEELKIDDVEPEDIGDEDALFGEGLGLDSLDAVELVVILKKHYKIDLEDMEKARAAFASIKALATYIRENSEVK
jgi:acyl carrier protein